jgi:hypothetical protein
MKSVKSTTLVALLIATAACAPRQEAKDADSTGATSTTPGPQGAEQHGSKHSAGMAGHHEVQGSNHGGPHEHMAKMHEQMGDHCPMVVQGATVSAADTPTGVALVFTTKGDVAELRRRVAKMAEHQQKMAEKHTGMMTSNERGGHEEQGAANNPHQHGDQGAKGSEGGCTCHMQGAGMQGRHIEKTVQVVEIEGGAQLVYMPKESTDLTDLRNHVKAKAQAMQEGKCPMMKEHGMQDCPMMKQHGEAAGHDHGAPPAAAH